METKHSFIILNLFPYELFFERNAAKIISYQAKKTSLSLVLLVWLQESEENSYSENVHFLTTLVTYLQNSIK